MEALQIIALFTITALLVFFAIYLLRSFFIDTPYYPSRIKALDEAWMHLDIDTKDKKFIDLGSGDGRTVFWASKRGMDATGVEINPFLSLFSRFKNLFTPKNHKATFINKDFIKVSLQDYDIVYLYLFSEVMHDLQEKIFSELKPGSLIVSNVFTFKDREPDRVYKRFKVYEVRQ